MATQRWNVNVSRHAATASSERLRKVAVPAVVSSRDYGFDLCNYFGDDVVEVLNLRVQGKGGQCGRSHPHFIVNPETTITGKPAIAYKVSHTIQCTESASSPNLQDTIEATASLNSEIP